MRIRATNRGAGGVFATVWGQISVCLGAVVFACAQAAAAPFGYVANLESNTVSVIDAATNAVVATIPVGGAPRDVAVSSDGSRAYVTSYGDGTVSAINTGSNTVIATIPVGNRPQGVAVSPDGKRAYVPSLWDGTVSVIDTAGNSVIATISFSVAMFGDPSYTSIAISPDGKHAYVAYGDGTDGSGNSGDWLAVIDTSSNTAIAWVPVDIIPSLLNLKFVYICRPFV